MKLFVILPRGRPHTEHFLLLSRIVLGIFTYPLPSNKRPIVTRVGFRGNVFTEPLPSNGLCVAIYLLYIGLCLRKDPYIYIFLCIVYSSHLRR
jgi:hypothetical protein